MNQDPLICLEKMSQLISPQTLEFLCKYVHGDNSVNLNEATTNESHHLKLYHQLKPHHHPRLQALSLSINELEQGDVILTRDYTVNIFKPTSTQHQKISLS